MDDEGNDQSITELVNELVGEETEPEGIEVDVAKAKEAENKARSDAMNDLKKQQASASVAEAKKSAGTLKQQMDEIRKENAAYKKELEAIKAQLSSVNKDVSVHSDRMLTDDVIAQERELAKHPKYGKYFKQDDVRNFYVNTAQKEKRYFSPLEAMKQVTYDTLLDKLEKYEKNDEFRKLMMEGGFTSSNDSTEVDPSDVKDISDIGSMMRKQAEKMGLS